MGGNTQANQLPARGSAIAPRTGGSHHDGVASADDVARAHLDDGMGGAPGSAAAATARASGAPVSAGGATRHGHAVVGPLPTETGRVTGRTLLLAAEG